MHMGMKHNKSVGQSNDGGHSDNNSKDKTHILDIQQDNEKVYNPNVPGL